MAHIVLSVLMVTLTTATGWAEIYSWTDPSGIKHFSNVQAHPSTPRPRIAKETRPKAKAVKTTGRKFKVLAVYDGDSIKVKGSNLTLMVRLVGIDAPETGHGKNKGQPFSQQSKRLLKKLVSGKKVTLKSYGMGRYNRQLAEVFTKKSVNVNLKLLKTGLAEVYRGRTAEGIDLARYRQAEAAAKRSYKGIWSLGYRYQSPRQWRKQHPRK
jgi:endonuclease YncB( thermonuclease family)